MHLPYKKNNTFLKQLDQIGQSNGLLDLASIFSPICKKAAVSLNPIDTQDFLFLEKEKN